jgi:hypothetical protein
MALNEFPKFIGERAHPVMFLLPSNVGSNLYDIGFGDRKSAVASSPRKFPRQNVVCIHPVGRTSLQELNQFLDGQIRWEIDQCVDVIGVHVIDLHVNAFGVGVFSEVTGEASRSDAASSGNTSAHIGVERKPLKRLMSISSQESPA